MRRILQKVLWGVIAATPITMTGCATHTGHGVVAGAAIGAGAGALIGHAAGDSGAGALIGAGAGAALGGLIGNSYDAYDQGYAHGHYDGGYRYSEPPRNYAPHPRYRPRVERRYYHYHLAPPPHLHFDYHYCP